MDHVGMDVHEKESQLYILTDGGEIIERRIRTEPERFAAGLSTRPRARILIDLDPDYAGLDTARHHWLSAAGRDPSKPMGASGRA